MGESGFAGLWDGRYDYARRRWGGPVSFTASILQDGAALTGETIEPDAITTRGGGGTLMAGLRGDAGGRDVRLVKIYTDAELDPVFYEGVADATRDRIEGHWCIPGTRVWGPFSMIRRTRGTAEAERTRAAVAVPEEIDA